MTRTLIALVALVFAVAAASPDQVADDLGTRGYFIESGADASDDVVGRAVSDARSDGSLFYAVVLAEEPPAGATTAADAVLDELPRTEGTVLVVAPETVGWASNGDVWTTDQLDGALDASLDGRTSDDVVMIFVGELISPSAGGGPWILLALALGVAAVVAFFVWRSSRRSKERRRATLEELRSKAQAQVDAVANDILEDEDEIEEARNPEASRHFDDATRIYGRAAEELPGATTPAEIVGISAELDQAIWHLDAAEAILDGKPVPPKPEPPALPSPDSVRTVPARPPPQQPASLPRYERRSSRRSGFGADDMLSAVLAMQAMRSVSGRSGRPSGRSSRSGGGRSRSSGRSRGGGRRRR